MSRDCPPIVFLSHVSSDRWVAKQLQLRMQERGAEVFLDETDVEHGDDIEEAIIDALDRSTEIVALLTPAALQSHYIWLELGHFWAARKRIVALLYGLDQKGLSTSERIPIFLKKIKVLALDEVERYMNELEARVKAAGGGDG